MTEQNDAIAILGGTGDQGLGLAFRFAKAGRTVIIGSRKAERAVTAAEEVAATVPGASVSGCGNEEATAQAGVVIISVPFEHTAGTVKGIKTSLREGQILVSMAVPLATAVGDGAVRTLGIWQGSCAEMVASLVPDGVEVVSAFQNVSAHRLRDLENEVDCDIVVSGKKKAPLTCTGSPSLARGLNCLSRRSLGSSALRGDPRSPAGIARTAASKGTRLRTLVLGF
jgi:hypothetical protein